MRHPGFGEGFVSLLDVNRKIEDSYKTDKTELEADLKSLESDWKAVGEDLFIAIEKYVKE